MTPGPLMTRSSLEFTGKTLGFEGALKVDYGLLSRERKTLHLTGQKVQHICMSAYAKLHTGTLE